ncbi:MAG: hypothetical protein KL863_02135 [Rhizobium sp.]|nr:hypothetical protein [Rhizobium sp.]
MKTLILVLALLALPGTASAAGGTWCDAKDANLTFHFKASHSRDGTGPWFGIEGDVTVRFGKLPKHLRKFTIKDDSLTQRWAGPEGVLLQVQKYDAEPFRSVILTVTTRLIEEATYQGTYELRITADSGDEAYVTRTGKVSCSAD